MNRVRNFLDRILRRIVADDPGCVDLSNLDQLDGIGCGECPPMTDAQAARLWRDIQHPPFADWDETRTESDWDKHVHDALAVTSSLPQRNLITQDDCTLAATWGLDLASTAEVDR